MNTQANNLRAVQVSESEKGHSLTLSVPDHEALDPKLRVRQFQMKDLTVGDLKLIRNNIDLHLMGLGVSADA